MHDIDKLDRIKSGGVFLYTKRPVNASLPAPQCPVTMSELGLNKVVGAGFTGVNDEKQSPSILY